MPNRIVRDAILSSERVASLGWAEEVLFRRLMSVVDDYGRHEANPKLLRSRCYPLQTDDVTVAQVTKWLASCQKAGVLVLYASGGKEYLELVNFGQQIRSASKCPEPDSKCQQMAADAHLGVAVSECVSESVTEKDSCSEPQAATEPAVVTLPLNTGPDYPISQRLVDELAALYPSADVPSELRKMKGWLIARPAKRKTKTGIMRFVTNWLAREHDDAKTRTQGVPHATNRQSAADRVRANAIAGELADRANGCTNLMGQDGGDLWPPLD